MKIRLSLLLVFCSLTSFSQQIDRDKNLFYLGKVWGFLKYHHPAVTQGKLDWDRELAERIPKVMAAEDKAAINRIFQEWMASLGPVAECTKCREQTDAAISTVDFQWLSDQNVFTEEVSRTLEHIRRNRNQKPNHYANLGIVGQAVVRQFDAEQKYEQMKYPSADYRLLALFRYWNIIEYLYPYKNLIGQDWDKALVEMIPVFLGAKDSVAYNLALMELNAKLNDSHASAKFLIASPSLQYLGEYWAPFDCVIIGNKAVVTKLFNDSLAAIDDVQIGDILTRIDGKSIKDLLALHKQYIGSPNQATFNRDFFPLLWSQTDQATVTLSRKGETKSRNIKRYPYQTLQKLVNEDDLSKPLFEYKTWDKINNGTGYINMGSLKAEEVDNAFDALSDAKALIIDLRNNTTDMKSFLAVCDKVSTREAKFTRYAVPDSKNPGAFRWSATSTCGKDNNKKAYKGKVIVLINENTQSRGENACMGFQACADVTLIGTPTAGANGDVSYIPLPGGYMTAMTGQAVFYPDSKTMIHRTGIQPTIKVAVTAEGLSEKRDEILQKAIEHIEQ